MILTGTRFEWKNSLTYTVQTLNQHGCFLIHFTYLRYEIEENRNGREVHNLYNKKVYVIYMHVIFLNNEN